MSFLSEGCKGHTHKVDRENVLKVLNFMVSSGYLQVVFRVFSGSFRIFCVCVCVFPMPFQCPLHPSKLKPEYHMIMCQFEHGIPTVLLRFGPGRVSGSIFGIPRTSSGPAVLWGCALRMRFSDGIGRECNSESCSENALEIPRVAPRIGFHSVSVFCQSRGGSQGLRTDKKGDAAAAALSPAGFYLAVPVLVPETW